MSPKERSGLFHSRRQCLSTVGGGSRGGKSRSHSPPKRRCWRLNPVGSRCTVSQKAQAVRGIAHSLRIAQGSYSPGRVCIRISRGAGRQGEDSMSHRALSANPIGLGLRVCQVLNFLGQSASPVIRTNNHLFGSTFSATRQERPQATPRLHSRQHGSYFAKSNEEGQTRPNWAYCGTSESYKLKL